jgi:uncharacterized phage-associated protein
MHTHQQFEQQKTKELVAYISSKVPDVRKTKLMKLLYLIDFTAYAKSGKAVTNGRYIRFPMGPVLEQVYQEWGAERYESILTSSEAPNTSVFDAAELAIIDAILTQYGQLNRPQLIELTHDELPWQVTKTGEEIPYYLAPYRNYRPLTDDELAIMKADSEYMAGIMANLEAATKLQAA